MAENKTEPIESEIGVAEPERELQPEPNDPRYAIIVFHADTAAYANGLTAGVLDREYGSVYPFPDAIEARAALPEFGPDPSETGLAWSPHYSSEYDELPD